MHVYNIFYRLKYLCSTDSINSRVGIRLIKIFFEIYTFIWSTIPPSEPLRDLDVLIFSQARCIKITPFKTNIFR